MREDGLAFFDKKEPSLFSFWSIFAYLLCCSLSRLLSVYGSLTFVSKRGGDEYRNTGTACREKEKEHMRCEA